MINSGLEKTLLLVYFVPVLLTGLIGNAWVILSVIRVYKTSSPTTSEAFKHMSLYILFLSCADLCVSINIAMAIRYSFTRHGPEAKHVNSKKAS